jgi:SprT protein
MQKNNIEIFEKYLPELSVAYCYQLWEKHKFHFKITKPRQTKLGDYSYRKDRGHVVTVNANLNSYSFLVTYIHEVAHLVTFEQYGNKPDPHGIEWKRNFKKTFEPILNNNVLPVSVLTPLEKYLENPSASTIGSIDLVNALRTFDLEQSGITLESLEINTKFILNGQLFQKGELRRKRYLCTDCKTGKRYVVLGNALVSLSDV